MRSFIYVLFGLTGVALSRKPSSGEDVMTMTIEFLRARLLSERSASKAAKQRALQLGKKVYMVIYLNNINREIFLTSICNVREDAV